MATNLLDAKGKPATLYPKNSQACHGCNETLPRVMVSEFRPSLGREVSWSALDGKAVSLLNGGAYHKNCAAQAKTQGGSHA